MNYEMAQIHFRIKESASAIEIFLKDSALIDDAKTYCKQNELY